MILIMWLSIYLALYLTLVCIYFLYYGFFKGLVFRSVIRHYGVPPGGNWLFLVVVVLSKVPKFDFLFRIFYHILL
jgi:hypothetical protein